MPTKGDFIPIIGSVAAAIIAKSASDAANKANAQNVQKQIDFQREQNATAHQRGVADMTAAGLNPALGYGKSGADSGSGAAANQQPHKAGEAALEAYNQFANGTAQRQLIREQAALTSAQARRTMLEGNILGPQSQVSLDGGYIEQYGRTAKGRARAEEFTAGTTQELYGVQLGATRQSTATAKQQEQLMRTQSTLNEQEFQNAWFRKNIAPYINSTSKTMEGVGNLGRTSKGLTGYTPHSRYY